MKFRSALVYGKLINLAINVIDKSRGSNKAGDMAMAKCPDMMKHFKGIDPSKVLFITGTNGKSSTNNLINHILTKQGYKVVSNLAGANLLTGICTALIKASDLSGNIDADFFVFETDERYLHKIRENLPCDNLLVTNIQKDQVQRNGDPDYIYRKISKVAEEFGMRLFLNADEPRANSLGRKASRVVRFGTAKHSRSFTKDDSYVTMPCPVCRHKIEFSYYNNDNVGGFRCVHCGFSNEDGADYITENADFENRTFTVKNVPFKMPYDQPYMLYNYSAAVAAVKEIAGIEPEEAAKAFEDFSNISGRYETIHYKGKNIKYMRFKQENPETLQNFINVIASDPDEKVIVVGYGTVNDIIPSYINSFYGFDCDFSKMIRSNVKKFLCVTDTVCYDAANSFMYGGVDPSMIEILPTSDVSEILEAIAKQDTDNVYLTMELAKFEKMQAVAGKED